MLLQLDPEKRPNCGQIMAHPWLAPHLFRLFVSLGSLPCSTSKARPSTTPSSTSYAQGREGVLRKSPCSLQATSSKGALLAPTLTQIVKVELDDQGKSTKAPLRVNNVLVTLKGCSLQPNSLQILHETCEEVIQLVACGGAAPRDEALIVTKDGKVLMISGQKSRPIDSFVGIAIQYVASAPNGGLICMLTDRGILITKGTYCRPPSLAYKRL